MNFERTVVGEVVAAFKEKPLIQVILGPRQVGKTTAATQVVERSGLASHVASADSPSPLGPEWIETQ